MWNNNSATHGLKTEGTEKDKLGTKDERSLFAGIEKFNISPCYLTEEDENTLYNSFPKAVAGYYVQLWNKTYLNKTFLQFK